MSSLPLVGHQEVLERLERAWQRGRLGQAFLFVGPEGIGKRRLALHFAQSLLCERNQIGQLLPCGMCSPCKQVLAGNHPDLQQLAKPAEKNEFPIHLIHQLCTQLSLKPAWGRYKIAIVDDADAFNEESANAFLKTLEEPPPRAILILIGTRLELQLPTIRSRCQLLSFLPLAEEDLSSLLQELLPETDPGKIHDLLAWCGGSVSRALELHEPEWQDFHRALLPAIVRLPAETPALMQLCLEFIESAGKESAPKRQRACTIIQLTAELYRSALHHQQGRADRLAGARSPMIQTLAQQCDAETLLDLLERCLQADQQIGRFLNHTLTIECWLDDLQQILTGQFVPTGY